MSLEVESGCNTGELGSWGEKYWIWYEVPKNMIKLYL